MEQKQHTLCRGNPLTTTPPPPQIQSLHTKTPVTQAVFVNNAGSLGPLDRIGNLSSLSKLRSEIDMNVTGTVWLTTRWVGLCRELFGGASSGASGGSGAGGGAGAGATATATNTPGLIVNISSLAGKGLRCVQGKVSTHTEWYCCCSHSTLCHLGRVLHRKSSP